MLSIKYTVFKSTYNMGHYQWPVNPLLWDSVGLSVSLAPAVIVVLVKDDGHCLLARVLA